jgi:hypothetical protein
MLPKGEEKGKDDGKAGTKRSAAVSEKGEEDEKAGIKASVAPSAKST